MPIINTNLENEFNLAPMTLDESEEIDESKETAIEISDNQSVVLNNKLDKINAALPQVWGLDSTDKELDDIAEKAMSSYSDLMELAMNIEQRFIGEVSSSAATMLGHAITARTNKIKKKLDMVTLQIKKQLADHKTKQQEEPEELEGKSDVFDRNDLLKRLLDK